MVGRDGTLGAGAIARGLPPVSSTHGASSSAYSMPCRAAIPSPRWAVPPPSWLGSRFTSPSRRHGTGSGVKSSGTQRPCSGAGGLVGCARATSGGGGTRRARGSKRAATFPTIGPHLLEDGFPHPWQYHLLFVPLASARGTDAERASRSVQRRAHESEGAHSLTGAL